MVYIREAHASDAWQLSVNLEENVVYATPRSYEEKAGVARLCVKDLGIEFPALLDDFQNTAETAYTAWPDRLYLVDAAGRIAYKSKPGPFGFRPAEAEAALIALLHAPDE